MEITPAQAQLQVELGVKAGRLFIKIVDAPGDQGAGMTGMQGMGVSTPEAAAVAAATVGLADEEHNPKGGILTIGA